MYVFASWELSRVMKWIIRDELRHAGKLQSAKYKYPRL